MKRKEKKAKFIKMLCSALTFAIVGVAVWGLDAQAGSNDVVLDNSSFAENLNTSKWNNPDEDVLIQDNKMIFPENSTGDTRVITQGAVKTSDQYDTLLTGTYTMKVTNLPEGKRFVIAFGLDNVESICEEAESVEVAFVNDSGLKVQVVAYDETGERQVLQEAKTCGITVGKSFKVEAEITSDMRLKVIVNGQSIYNEKVPVNMEGRMGFLQTGSCEAEISEVNMRIYRYETPENCNITEDFENGTININALASKMINTCSYYPAGVHVEEYDGSKVLMFRNVGCGYIGTTYRYSNFEITFDIPYMLHSSDLREDGSIKAPANYGFAVAYGGDSQHYDHFGFETAADAIVFSGTDVYSYKYPEQKVGFADKNFYDKDKNEGFSVKITVKDTILTLEMKALKASEYEKILSYQIGEVTPTGNVHIWSTGQSNFAIDNLSIVNKDEGAQLIDVDYQSGIVEKQPDWEYEPMNASYLEEAEEQGEWITYIPLLSAAVVGVVLLAISLLVVKLRKRPGKESDFNEV